MYVKRKQENNMEICTIMMSKRREERKKFPSAVAKPKNVIMLEAQKCNRGEWVVEV